MNIRPIKLKEAKEFIELHHRHNKPPVGWKFGVGVEVNSVLVGVATAGRPVARHFDNQLTIEINRTCTNGQRNANSMLYGAIIKIARAMGYQRVITYSQLNESGASLRAVQMRQVKLLPAREGWKKSNTGGVERVLWELVL